MEKINFVLHDSEYEYTSYTHERRVARAFVMNDKNEIAILHIKGVDAFGVRDYFETPGGGVEDNETYEDAVIRELDEEIGFKCEIIEYLGSVRDEYNLIKRINLNKYYLCKVISKTHKHYVSEGDKLIESLLWVKIEELYKMYLSMSDKGVSLLVKNRELPFIKLILENYKEI